MMTMLFVTHGVGESAATVVPRSIGGEQRYCVDEDVSWSVDELSAVRLNYDEHKVISI